MSNTNTNQECQRTASQSQDLSCSELKRVEGGGNGRGGTSHAFVNETYLWYGYYDVMILTPNG